MTIETVWCALQAGPVVTFPDVVDSADDEAEPVTWFEVFARAVGKAG